MTVHEWRGHFIAVCHTCGATTSHTTRDVATTASCTHKEA